MLPRALGPELERLSSAMSAAYAARPLTQGAVVVCPRRPAARLSELPLPEAADLFATAAAAMAAAATAAAEAPPDGFNWSMKDSWALQGGAGAEPEQLHLHVVPRFAPTVDGMFCRDFKENDMVYAALELWHPSPDVANTPGANEWPDDDSRSNRTADDMQATQAVHRCAASEL